MEESTKKQLIIGTVALAVLGVSTYFLVRMMQNKQKYGVGSKTEEETETSTTTTTPVIAFNPQPYAKKLYTAMKGWGTDEDMIFNTMEMLTPEERKQVKKYFESNLGEGYSLREWFEGDLSGGDLERAKGYL